MSLQKASASREGTRLIHLRELDSPRLRARLAQLDVSWSRLTSDLSKIQEQLQQVQDLARVRPRPVPITLNMATLQLSIILLSKVNARAVAFQK